MDFKVLKWLVLLAVATLQVGCATAGANADDSPPDLTPVPAQDDSHGWGTSIQGNVTR
jgi:hypothetical protein